MLDLFGGGSNSGGSSGRRRIRPRRRRSHYELKIERMRTIREEEDPKGDHGREEEVEEDEEENGPRAELVIEGDSLDGAIGQEGMAQFDEEGGVLQYDGGGVVEQHHQHLMMMDELEQKCYDLDAKVRRVEEERDAVMNENEELHDQVRSVDQIQQQVNHLRQIVDRHHHTLDASALSGGGGNNSGAMGMMDPAGEELLRISEEVSRLDSTLTGLRDQMLTVSDRVKEVPVLKENVRTVMEETACVKEDFLNLKNHLNLAAKIELQTNEKMYENRLHHLEKMLEEMRHREESFLHIAEETNILKDQVDSLRELSLTSMRAVDQNPILDPGIRALQQQQQDHPSLGEELSLNADMASQRPDSLQISYDSPVTDQPNVATATVVYAAASSSNGGADSPGAKSSSRGSRGSSPVKVTGQVKLNLSAPRLAPLPSTESAQTQTTPTVAVEEPGPAAAVVVVSEPKKKAVVSLAEKPVEKPEEKPDMRLNCCSELIATAWSHFFD